MRGSVDLKSYAFGSSGLVIRAPCVNRQVFMEIGKHICCLLVYLSTYLLKPKHASSIMRTTGVSRYHLNSPFYPAHSVADVFISLCYNGHSRDGLLGRAVLRHFSQAT